MTWNEISKNWNKFRAVVRERWTKFSDEDLSVVRGRADRLATKLTERYRYSHERAQAEIADFCRTVAYEEKHSMNRNHAV